MERREANAIKLQSSQSTTFNATPHRRLSQPLSNPPLQLSQTRPLLQPVGLPLKARRLGDPEPILVIVFLVANDAILEHNAAGLRAPSKRKR